MHRRLYSRQHVLGPVFGLTGEDGDLRFAPFALGDIAGNFRRADDFAVKILNGRNRQRNVDQASVLALANSLIMLDALTAPNTFENRWLLVMPVGRNQDRDRLADNLFGQVAENPLRTPVPACDDAIKVYAYD